MACFCGLRSRTTCVLSSSDDLKSAYLDLDFAWHANALRDLSHAGGLRGLSALNRISA